ncbi:MAG: hypothetical protein DHS20C21_00660 [Gemmatimonadota bacterium]|nr:MAG: hypothetical protein DHS20C21_00660 [Gemmatimonadota bacterium]
MDGGSALNKDTRERERARLEQGIKVELETAFPKIEDAWGYGEAIVRDAKKASSYPESGYFRVHIAGLYHRGLRVVLGRTSIVLGADGVRLGEITGEQASEGGFLVGHVPFSRIVRIDWTGDEYYVEPHIYVLFRKGGACESVFVARRHEDAPGPMSYEELGEYSSSEKRSKQWVRRHGRQVRRANRRDLSGGSE